MHGPQQMSADPEEIQYESVHREEPLRMHGGLEPAHLSRRLMRDLSPVISRTGACCERLTPSRYGAPRCNSAACP